MDLWLQDHTVVAGGVDHRQHGADCLRR
jgi:hypothetical protein